jgi:2-amino-4-hydroxy-6-hydroxymethyldihydropteridine diphosphokinase
MKSCVYVGIGSNVNNPMNNIDLALEKLSTRTSLIRHSSFYESNPIDFIYQPLFINAVCEIYTELNPWEFLKILNTIEYEIGRMRTFPNAPRVIDLDIILWNNMTISTPTLKVPHPEIFNRGFVIAPLLELSFGDRYLKTLKSKLSNSYDRLPLEDMPTRLYK